MIIRLLAIVAISYLVLIFFIEVAYPKITGRQTFPSWRLRTLQKRLEEANDALDRIELTKKIIALEKQIGKAHYENNNDERDFK